ncbi:MAG: CPBP family intramembrane glutamic endopeptidase [Alphaproteobacteria bacterium]|jgi:membrane protease YdiL (CAAX protease family)|nr:CPBP family intramembrane glutamic endopeptidase [Alphaproteobacteria bacterium]
MKRTDFGLLEAAAVLFLHYTIVIGANTAAAAWDITLPSLPLFKQNYLFFALTLAILVWLKLRGETWESIGLKALRPRQIAMGVGLFVAVVIYSAIAQTALDQYIRELTGAGPNKAAEIFKSIEGNLPLFVLLLPITWLFAGFGEEVLYRGYLMTRFAQFMGETRTAWIVALFVQAALFGAAHWYQGPTGIVGTAIIGLILGAATLFWGRNLWPAIIAHALIDTLGFTLMYLGLYGR